MLCPKPFKAVRITEKVYPKVQEEKPSNWKKFHGGKFEFKKRVVKCLDGHSTHPLLGRITMHGFCYKAEGLDSREKITFLMIIMPQG